MHDRIYIQTLNVLNEKLGLYTEYFKNNDILSYKNDILYINNINNDVFGDLIFNKVKAKQFLKWIAQFLVESCAKRCNFEGLRVMFKNCNHTSLKDLVYLNTYRKTK